jgi:hypothetical protein
LVEQIFSATVPTPPANPCLPSPCGPNAECRERNGAGSCTCLPGYEGDPYDKRGCRRECELNSDCTQVLACITFKCVDPCPGTCGSGAQCSVLNHIPTCTCPPQLTGDPFFQCRELPPTRELLLFLHYLELENDQKLRLVIPLFSLVFWSRLFLSPSCVSVFNIINLIFTNLLWVKFSLIIYIYREREREGEGECSLYV